MEKKFLPLVLQGFEPANVFDHESGALTTKLSAFLVFSVMCQFTVVLCL